MDYAAEKGLDWGSGKAWEKIRAVKQKDSVCELLFDVVEKCVCRAIISRGDKKNLSKTDSVSSACEIIYGSIVNSGIVGDDEYLKIKLALQGDSLEIEPKSNFYKYFFEELCSDENTTLLKYFMLNMLFGIRNNISKENDIHKQESKYENVTLTENQYLKLKNSIQVHEQNIIKDTVNGILGRLQIESIRVEDLYSITHGAVADAANISEFENFINEYENSIFQIESDFCKVRIGIPVAVSKILQEYINGFKQYFQHARYLVAYRNNQDAEYIKYYLSFSAKMGSLYPNKHNEVVDSISKIIN